MFLGKTKKVTPLRVDGFVAEHLIDFPNKFRDLVVTSNENHRIIPI